MNQVNAPKKLIKKFFLFGFSCFLFINLYRFIAFVFNVGMTPQIPFKYNELPFWIIFFKQEKLPASVNDHIEGLVLAPIIENFCILLLYIVCVWIGKETIAKKFATIRLAIFYILTIYLFGLAHNTDITSFRFTTTAILAAFMCYIFVYTTKLPKANILIAYLVSAALHLLYNLIISVICTPIYYILRSYY